MNEEEFKLSLYKALGKIEERHIRLNRELPFNDEVVKNIFSHINYFNGYSIERIVAGEHGGILFIYGNENKSLSSEFTKEGTIFNGIQDYITREYNIWESR